MPRDYNSDMHMYIATLNNIPKMSSLMLGAQTPCLLTVNLETLPRIDLMNGKKAQ